MVATSRFIADDEKSNEGGGGSIPPDGMQRLQSSFVPILSFVQIQYRGTAAHFVSFVLPTSNF
jgi:hypothetical protein